MQNLLVANYGGGVNSVALLLWLHQSGNKPRAIVMSDPGHEKAATHTYRDTMVNPWLRTIGWPEVVVVSRESEAPFRPRSKWKGTLGDYCMRKEMLPSAAYGLKSCSIIFKAEPMAWWVERQTWAREVWSSGGRVLRAIGYDADEARRVNRHRHIVNGAAIDEFSDPGEAARFKPWYPLYDSGITREGCEQLIVSAGFPLPPKSSCTFCPYNSFKEWVDLRREYPEAFAYAVEMSRKAEATVTSETVGLMRRAKREAGTVRLHVWAERTACTVVADDDDDREEMPCECAD